MSELIRIAFIEQDTGIGGAEVNLFYLFERLDGGHFSPVVVVPHEGPLTERLTGMGVPFRVVSRPRFVPTSTFILGRKIFNPFAVLYDVFAFLPSVFRIRRFLKEARIAVVHTNSMVAHVYGGLAAKLAGVPCVWHMQDIVEPRIAFGLVRKTLVLLGGFLPDRIVVVSRAVGEMFTGKSADRVQVVYNGADTVRFSMAVDGSAVRKEFGISPDELVVGIVGRLTYWKGQREFLRAAAAVAERIPRVRFLIIGGTVFSSEAFYRELVELARELNIEEKVAFTGFRIDIPALTAALDICVHASTLPDPCPLVLLDYGAAGRPVVATAAGGVPEVVADGETGILVKPGDWKEMADAITRLAGNEELRKSMGEEARRHIVANLSVESFVDNMAAVYAGLCRRKKR